MNRMTIVETDILIDAGRLSHGLLIPDALIAATAIAHDQPLISKNQRDYSFMKELHLLPYPNCNE